MPTPADLRRPPLRAPPWHVALIVVVLVAAAGCAHAGDSRGNPRSTQRPPTPTGIGATAAVPDFDRDRFAAVIPVPGAATMAVSDEGANC
jgi:hypothetical protein